MKIFFNCALILILLQSTLKVVAQQPVCNNCTLSISGSGSYTLVSGQKACIASGQTFTGSIILNGGTLVNCGTFSPSNITFYEGEIDNNNSANFQSLLFNGPNTTFKNYGVATFASIYFEGGSLYNYNSLTVNNNFLVYTAVSNFFTTGSLIVNGDLTNYASTVNNTGTINITGNYNNNYGSVLQNSGSITVGNNYSNIGSFINRGSLTVTNASQINGGANFTSAGCSQFSTNTLTVIGALRGDSTSCSLLNIGTTMTAELGAILSGKINICSAGTINFAAGTQGSNVVLNCNCIPLTNTYTINGSAVSSTVPINTYTCSAITLTPTTTSATSYKIMVTATDATGNVLTGAGSYTYSTGLLASSPPATIDLKSLDANYLASHIGYFRVSLYVQNGCSSLYYNGLIENSTLSSTSSNFQLLDGSGNSFSPNNTLPGTNVSAYGVGINGSYSTGYIATYQITVDQVDCSTGSVLTAGIVNTPATPVSGGNPANILGVSLNTKSLPHGYFSNNAGCYKVTYTVDNACGSSVQTSYFNEDPDVLRLGTTTTRNVEGSVYPNPTNGLTTLNFTLPETNIVNLTLNNLQGGTSYNFIQGQHVNQGNNEIIFDTTILPAGLYFYQLSDDINTIQSGKLVVIK